MDELPRRRFLPHTPPRWVDSTREVWFLTVSTETRGRNQLALPSIGPAILETVAFRHARQLWFVHVFLLMPDHIHALMTFPSREIEMRKIVREWKRWVARSFGIEWQRDFFEHRLRREESHREKMDYILANPVRAGLVGTPEEWPYRWLPEDGGVYWFAAVTTGWDDVRACRRGALSERALPGNLLVGRAR